MNRLLVTFLVSSLFVVSACENKTPKSETPQSETVNLCTYSWYQSVESALPSGDGMGHGPDIGSAEWRSVIEFRLGIRGNADVPDRDSDEWCGYINGLLDG